MALSLPVELRSDTFTKPSFEMKEAMFNAPIGDDVFNEDPTVNELQDLAAGMFGKESALFCPSGTMTNQLAIKVHTQPGDEVICSSLAHIYNYEGGGIALNSMASVRLIHTESGEFTADHVLENLNEDNIHFPRTKLVSLENTLNKGGGIVLNECEVEKISTLCKAQKLKLHLDGARLFNALTVTNTKPEAYGSWFDTISICLSKGLGAPIGSLLIGSNEEVYWAKRYRKAWGGGMRQAGILAAAGIFALKNNVSRLSIDHENAKILESQLLKMVWVEKILPVQTNIVIFKCNNYETFTDLQSYFKSKEINVAPMGNLQIRFVTHLDITAEQIDYVATAIRNYNQ